MKLTDYQVAEAVIEELRGIDWTTGDGGYYFVKHRLDELEKQKGNL